MFSISFQVKAKSYTAKVQKIATTPIQYVVFDITPYLSIVPLQLTYESRAEDDALVYRSFFNSQAEILTLIGETIFKVCMERHIQVHR